MCGIFGYIGNNNSASKVLQGLKNLEYRGYDSWGIATSKNNNIHILKNVGEIDINTDISLLNKSITSIGHTRWATHGKVTTNNAHPHFSTNKDFALVQNGIVENYSELKNLLKENNFKFFTETDTEVIVRLIESYLDKENSFEDSIKKAFQDLQGRNTVMILTKDNDIYAIRNGSPLVIGTNLNETYIASDILSFSNDALDAIYIDDFDFISIKNNLLEISNLKTDQKKELKKVPITEKTSDIDKKDYDHFMLKEIVEQKECLKRIADITEEELKPISQAIAKSKRIYTVGAGTAGFAAGQIAYFLRNIANIDAIDIRSYDFDNYINIIDKNDLIFAISQSGETADTLDAINKAKEKGCKIASLVNMQGSTLSRISDFPLYSKSGPEICVASTKAFTSQISFGYLLSKTIQNKYKEAVNDLNNLSLNISKLFTEKSFNNIKELVKKLKKQEHFFVLGKGQNSYISLEAALKVKEITYKHFEGFSAGELKHGVIALVEKGIPVFSIISDDNNSADMISATQEVKARGSFTVGVGNPKFKDLDCFDFYIPATDDNDLSSVANVIPFQLISYFLALELGNNIDKPRNLAKSVTVK